MFGLNLDPEFVTHQREKAIHRWKWHRPWLAALLAFIHPVGMLYTSWVAFILYLALWSAVFFYWPSRPRVPGLVLASVFAAYAYYETVHKNAAVEKWKFGLLGTGHQNPAGLPPQAEIDSPSDTSSLETTSKEPMTSASKVILVFGLLWCWFCAWNWVRGNVFGPRVLGAATGFILWPFVIAYVFKGRKKKRDWNSFAKLFSFLTIWYIFFRKLFPY